MTILRTRPFFGINNFTMKKTNNQHKKIENRKYRSIFLAICLGFMAFYPFICRICMMKLPKAETEIYSSTNGYQADLVCYSKEIALIFFAGILLLYFLGEKIFPDKIETIDKDRLKNLRFPLICAGGYLALTLLSFAFSEYRDTALFGVNSEYEGMLAISAYIVLFLFGIYYLKPSNEKIPPLVILRTATVIMCFVAGVLGVLEVFDKPLLEHTFIQDLISSEKERELAHSITCENFIGQIALLFNNPGYLGGFCALFIPVVFSASLEYSNLPVPLTSEAATLCTETKPRHNGKIRMFFRIFSIVTLGLMGLALVWSRSTVAKVSLFLSIPLVILLYLVSCLKKQHLDTKTTFLPLITNLVSGLVLAIVLVVLSNVLPNSVSKKHDLGLDTTLSEYSDTAASDLVKTDSTVKKFHLQKATLENGILNLYSDTDFLQVSMKPNALYEMFLSEIKDVPSISLIFSDGEKEISATTPAIMKSTTIMKEMPGFKLDDPRYEGITIALDDQLIIFDFGYKGTVEFYMTEYGLKIFGQGSTLLNEIPQPRVTGLESFYTFATGRGYVWVQSLPILKNCFLLGKGNGCFGFYFTQNEIVGLLNTHGSCKYAIDRPHNWYIQIAVSSGIPALLCVLLLFLYYIFSFLKSTLKKETPGNAVPASSSLLLTGIFAGLVGFMLCGMINDSYITVNPFFWLLLGTGIANLKSIFKPSSAT